MPNMYDDPEKYAADALAAFGALAPDEIARVLYHADVRGYPGCAAPWATVLDFTLVDVRGTVATFTGPYEEFDLEIPDSLSVYIDRYHGGWYPELRAFDREPQTRHELDLRRETVAVLFGQTPSDGLADRVLSFLGGVRGRDNRRTMETTSKPLQTVYGNTPPQWVRVARSVLADLLHEEWRNGR